MGCGRFTVLPLHSEANSLKKPAVTAKLHLRAGKRFVHPPKSSAKSSWSFLWGGTWGHQSATLCLAFPSVVCWGPLVQNATLAFSDCFDFTAASEILYTERKWVSEAPQIIPVPTSICCWEEASGGDADERRTMARSHQTQGVFLLSYAL